MSATATILVTSIGPATDGTIDTLASALCNVMTKTDCLYLFSSSWPNHPGGYVGYGFYTLRKDTSGDGWWYVHIIDGNTKVWDIYKSGTNTRIKAFS